MLVSLVFATTLCASSAFAAEQSSFDLKSPDKRIEVRIRTAHGIHYDVVLGGRAILEDSTLSMDVDHKVLGKDATKVVRAKATTHDEVVEPVVRQKFAKIRDHYNEQRIEFDGGFAVTFRAYNEGVAYRFETSLPASEIKIYSEEMNLNFAANDIAYYPTEDSFMSHNERKYLPQRLSEILPETIASLPAVVEVGQGASVAVAESDVDEYPGLWLKGTGGPGLAATFPPFPLKDHKDTWLNVPVTEAADYIAVTKGTRTYPWRVLGIVDHDQGLADKRDRVSARESVEDCGHFVDQAGESCVGLVERAEFVWRGFQGGRQYGHVQILHRLRGEISDSIHHSR